MREGTAMKRAEEPTTLSAAKRGDLFAQVNDLFNRVARRAFEIFETNGRLFGRDLDDWFQAERELLHPVHINLSESDESLEVKAEVPGFNEKELEISVEPCRLTIAGQRETTKEEKKGKTIYSETCADQILRVVDLPVEIETDKVTATLKYGVLDLVMPKAAKARTIRVQPKAA